VVVPSKAAQFPKWPLLGRCRLGVTPEPANENISAPPTQMQAQTQPRFRDPNQDFANHQQRATSRELAGQWAIGPPGRGKSRESFNRSRHPLGTSGPGNSLPEGSVFPKTPSAGVATGFGPKRPLDLFSPLHSFLCSGI